ncbi:PREDICTED: NACHT, LRR and PYD domains-containing protein 7 [Propithecus coquereli]|uniref:NACHT, LRR and PYD domains-containing protein 7 n=1 Tax=Propithecus coquereli TaxID=379532 RepID=UPI00063F1DF6|nr:PREDICTED: NACHT, LRR and PYD domains-containing protein 7 [Propithecus coquereli]
MASLQPKFSLETLLEQLNEDELRRFKSLLKNVPLQGKLRMTSWSKVEEADGKKLAEILMEKSPKYWIRSVTMNILEKMNLTELSKRAKAQIPAGALEQGIHDPKLGDMEEDLDVEKLGKKGGRRNTMEKPPLVWNNKFWRGDSDHFLDDVTQRSQKFIPFLRPKTPTQPIPHTVVLHGPAGVGKTTLARKVMLDWTENHVGQTFRCVFYLSCKELNRTGPCTFAELISKDWPEGQGDVSKVLAQAQKMLFVIDGFEELKVPEGSLIQDICGDWEEQKPVPVLLGSLLKRKMSPKATLLVTTRSEALRELRLLLQQPLFLEIEGFLEQDRKAYFLKHFEDEEEALRAFDLMRSNSALIRNVAPDNAYRDFCLALIGKKTLTHLTLEGQVQWDEMMLTMLCEILRNKQCSLQHLRLGFHSATAQQWADLSSALKINQSLTCLDLSANELLDEGVKLLHTTLKDPKCFLQRLSLEDCHLTEACCKALASVLVVHQQLRYLCLAKNDLGNSGVKLLCEGLGYPDCKLETLVLRQCNINRHGCKHLSKLLQEYSSLINLDLGLNPITAGLWFLCEALKNPNCNLKCLGLWCCSLTPFSCQDLASALISNQKLETLDLSQNNLGNSGVTVLLEALTQKNGPLKTLRLKAYDCNWKIQKLLKEVKEINPRLTIECNVARTTGVSCC